MHNFTSIIILMIATTSLSLAQGGPGRQFNPTQMANDEKQILLDSIKGLNDDQQLIIDAIYQDYISAVTKARENFDSGDRASMRASMMKVQEEKNEALAAVLTEEQYSDFLEILERRREQAQQRRQGRRNQ